MSRHRNLNSYKDEYDDVEDAYDDFEEEIYRQENGAEGDGDYVYVNNSNDNRASGASSLVSNGTNSTGESRAARKKKAKSKNKQQQQQQQQLAVGGGRVETEERRPPSKFSESMVERLATVPPPPPPHLDPDKTRPSFDFSTPSPDGAIAEARRTQKRGEGFAHGGRATSETVTKKREENNNEVDAKKKPAMTKAELKQETEDDARDAKKKPLVNLVVIGHVDAGKSTLMGHLLYDLQYITQKEMHKNEKESKESGKASFKYAWVMDQHAEERARGVTVDVGVKRIETPSRRVVILDSPGHRDFIPNMIAGAAQADAAILVVPAAPNEFESAFSSHAQTKEHAVLASRLGIKRLIVAVNKMDACGWSRERFEFVRGEIVAFLRSSTEFLTEAATASSGVTFVPCSGLTGANLLSSSQSTQQIRQQYAWSTSFPSLLEAIDALPPAALASGEGPLRLVVSDAYKTAASGSATVVGGKMESGALRIGDTVALCPMNVTAAVKSLSSHGDAEVRRVRAGENVEVVLHNFSGGGALDPSAINSGTVMCSPTDRPVSVGDRLTCRVRGLEEMKMPLLNGSNVILHLHAAEIPAVLVEIKRTLREEDLSTLKKSPRLLKRGDVGEVVLRTDRAVCFDFEGGLSRVVLRVGGITVAAGSVISEG